MSVPFLSAFGIRIANASVVTIVSDIRKRVDAGETPVQVTGVNLEQMALLKSEPLFRSYLERSDIINIDGTIVYLFLKWLGLNPIGRGLCADLLYGLLSCAANRGESIFLLGAEQDTVEKVSQELRSQYPGIRIAGMQNGYYVDELEVVEKIAASKADYLFIGMPSPRKERFASIYKDQLNVKVCLGVGGMFDIIAGKAKRAPHMIQKLGFEWLYRITQNPFGHARRIIRALLPAFSLFVEYKNRENNVCDENNI